MPSYLQTAEQQMEIGDTVEDLLLERRAYLTSYNYKKYNYIHSNNSTGQIIFSSIELHEENGLLICLLLHGLCFVTTYNGWQ